MQQQHEEDAGLTMTGLTEKIPHYMLLALASDAANLCFCIYLLMQPNTWTPGVLLLLIASLESCAAYYDIDGTNYQEEDGYSYPTLWWRYATSGASLFILTRLLELEKLIEQ